MEKERILTKKRFTKMIEECVQMKKMGYMDAILHICEVRGLDPSDVGKLVAPPIKEKLKAECISVNLIKNDTSTLPV